MNDKKYITMYTYMCYVAQSLLILALASVSALIVVGCTLSRNATQKECETILSKIIALELEEQGIEDSVLIEKHSNHFKHQHPEFFKRCLSTPFDSSVLPCLEKQSSVEAMVHDCF